MPLLLAIVFVLSGAAGLMYESIWSRYLGLFVGHSSYAQVIVLVIFLGGMSLGAALVSRRSEGLRNPLLGYAAIELVVGLLGLVFHDVYEAVTAFAYASVFPVLADGPWLVPVKWLLGAVLILPQSVLLGATFPLMSAGLIRLLSGDGVSNSGRALSLLYFANSLGAALGVLVAGFWLVGVAGLPGTVLAAAILNILCALVVYGAVRLQQDATDAMDGDAEADAAPSHPEPSPELPALRLLLLATALGTAIASFVYEIAWVRMLSLVLGSATHSFELMLSAFILGLSLGALWLRSRADRLRDPLYALALVQWVMGGLAIATIAWYVATFHWTAWLLQALDSNDAGYTAFTVARYAICLLIMLPATFCAGITLPLITRILLGAGAGERAIGQVYAVNTIGSILGAGLAALVLLPTLGLRNLLILGGLVDIAFGLLILAWLSRRRPALGRRITVFAGATAMLLFLAAVGERFDAGIVTSGVYRYGSVPEAGTRKVVFYADGRTATVSVRQGTGAGGGTEFSLASNGKPDASLSRIWFDPIPDTHSTRRMDGDESTQLMLPLTTLAHVPTARRAAVIGQGSGMSSHFLLGSPHLASLVTIDIEPEMINASRVFRRANHRVFDDPRSRFVHDDAKSFFAASDTKYDLILSEPSNPWVSGVSGLFTDEFYARVRGYLTPDGVFGQWLHLYEIDDGLVLSVIKAVHRNFPSYRIYLTMDVDILIVASNRPELPAPDWGAYRYPEVAKDLRRFLPLDDQSLDVSLLVNRATLDPLVGDGRGANSDFYPVLDLGTERTRFRRTYATGLYAVSGDRFDLVAALEQRRVGRRSALVGALKLPRLQALTLGARLRANVPAPLVDSAPPDRAYRQALVRVRTLDAVLEAPRAPAEWTAWVRQAMEVERDLHGGMMGDADSAYFGRLLAYATRWGAPDDAVAAIRFMRALAFYDWPAAAAEAPLLVRARAVGRPWLNDDLLRDGATLSLMRTGDLAGARKAFNEMGRFAQRNTGDFRVRLLAAHLERAEGRGQRTEAR